MITPDFSYSCCSLGHLYNQLQANISMDTQRQQILSMVNASQQTAYPPAYLSSDAYTNIYAGWTYNPVATLPAHPPEKTNCVNCGAPLKGKHKCEYCDTYNQ